MLNKIIYLLFFISSVQIYAQNKADEPIKQYVLDFINGHVGDQYKSASLKTQTIAVKDDFLKLVFNDHLFVLYSESVTNNSILAYSFNNGISDYNKTRYIAFLRDFYKNNYQIKHKHQPFDKQKNVVYGPLLSSLFGQVNCHDENYNIINVSNLYTPGHVAVGCVAITLASVLHYYQWPIHGANSLTYQDNWGSVTGEHTVNFEQTYYDWSNILNRYDYAESSAEQRAALGQLSYNCAVALEMDFENGGSTANVNEIPGALSKYFKHYGEYISNTSDDFFNLIDQAIENQIPVPLAVYGNGYGHSVVCDGYQVTESGQKYYHLNMGWWGASNGWYQIHDEFNAGGYSSISGGVFNLVPTPDLTVRLVANTFEISWQTPDSIPFSGYELQIKRGRNHWEKLANLSSDTSYQTANGDENTYAFRIKMQYSNLPDIDAWSNIVVHSNTSINTAFDHYVHIYPNPVKNYLTLEGLKFGTAATIFSMDGMFVLKAFLQNQNKQVLNTEHLKSGSYVLQLETDKQAVVYRKFIKY